MCHLMPPPSSSKDIPEYRDCVQLVLECLQGRRLLSGQSVPVPGHCTVSCSSSEEKWDSLRQMLFHLCWDLFPRILPALRENFPTSQSVHQGKICHGLAVLLKELFLLFRRIDSNETFEHSARRVVKISN